MVRPCPMTAARSSMARRMADAISTGCTSDLKARAKAPLTARSRRCSTRSNRPMGATSSRVARDAARAAAGAVWSTIVTGWSGEVGHARRVALQARDVGRDPVWRSWGAYATIGRSHARVAERQTRCVQVAVSERAWGFKSPLAHASQGNPPGYPAGLTENLG